MRIARITQVYTLLTTLISLCETYVMSPIFSPDSKQMEKNRRIASKKTNVVKDDIRGFQSCFRYLFGTSEPFVPTEVSSKNRTKMISLWNKHVNWYNIWCAGLRRDASDPSTPLERFIRDNPLPSYDSTNGFQTQDELNAHIERLVHPVVGTVKNPMEEEELDTKTEGSVIGLWVSSHRTIFSATTAEFMVRLMGMLEYLVTPCDVIFRVGGDERELSDSSPSSDQFYIYRRGRGRGRLVGRDGHPTPASLFVAQDGVGSFLGYTLLLSHNDLKIPSSAQEIINKIKMLPDGEARLHDYDRMCRARIGILLSTHFAPDSSEMFSRCEMPDCPHGDGFIGRRGRRLVCPAGHVQCARCTRIHSGVCDDLREREQLPSNHVRCPNTVCGYKIEKESGCNHMTCICGQNFCFTCGMMFTSRDPYFSHSVVVYNTVEQLEIVVRCDQFNPLPRHLTVIRPNY